MNGPSGKRSTIWRFSLREMLLVMLATAATLGWARAVYQKYSRFSSTPFVTYFSGKLRSDFVEVCKSLGEPDAALIDNGSAGSGGKSGIHQQLWAELRLSSGRDDAFFDAIQERIIDRIKECSCIPGNCAVHSDEATTQLPVHYHHGPTAGVIQLFIHRKDDQTVHITATLDELKPR
jgi:hypothetical protein